MGPRVSRFVRSSAALVALVALAGLGACDEQEAVPSGPEGQQPSFYHGDGLQEDETADAIKPISDNISGGGSEVCNDSRVKDTNIVGDDEDTWSGRKVDPPEDLTADGFVFDVQPDGKSLDWNDTGKNLMQAVLIKAGDNSIVYYYNEGDPAVQPDPVEDFSDSGLDGDDDKAISHYVYCFVPQPPVVRGLKFDDADADGSLTAGEDSLPGWEIRAYADDGDSVLTQSEVDAGAVATTTTADGSGRLEKGRYEFFLDPGDYVVCEEDRDGWNQSGPSNAADACAAGSGLAEDGHALSLEAGEISEGNDFGNNQTTIEVTVLDSNNGEPVEGHTVIATHSQNGPYRDGGDGSSLRDATTDTDGFAVIGGLEAGDYCVRSSPLGVPSGRVIPPSNPDEAPQLAEDVDLRTAVSGDPDFRGAPLTLDHYKAECLNTPDSNPDKPRIQPGDAVTLVLQDGPGTVDGSFQTLDDDDVEISAWMVADLTGLVTWDVPSTDVADTKIGLFVTAAPDGDGTTNTGNDGPSFEIQTPGGAMVIESDLVPLDAGGFQTASASASEDGDVGTVPTDLEHCVTISDPEPGDDGGGNGELIGPVTYGFLATAELQPIDDAIGIAYAQEPSSGKLSVRAVSNSKKSFNADYTCDADGTCTLDNVSGGLAKDVTVKLGTAGGDRIRWAISGSGIGEAETIQFGISTPNDKFPNASLDEDNDGRREFDRPLACQTGGSRWVLGG